MAAKVQTIIGDNCNVLSIPDLQDAFRKLIGSSPATYDREQATGGVVALQKILATSVHQTDSVLRFNRFLRQLDQLLQVLQQQQGKHPKHIYRRLEMYFSPTRTEPTLLTWELLTDKFTTLVDMTDAEQLDKAIEAADQYLRYLEGVSSLEDNSANTATLESVIDELWNLQLELDNVMCRTIRVIVPYVKMIVTHLKCRTSKATVMAEFYPSGAVRFVGTDTVRKLLARTRSVVPYEDRDSMRYQRFARRADRVLRDLSKGNSWSHSIELMWAMRCYFSPLHGPQMNRLLLQTLFGKLVRLVHADDAAADDAAYLKRITKCIGELHDWLECVETVADDIGILYDTFEQFVEEVGLLRENEPHNNDRWWELIALRVDSLKSLVRLDDDPSKRFVYDTLMAVNHPGQLYNKSADDWPLTHDAVLMLLEAAKTPHQQLLRFMHELYLSKPRCVLETMRYRRFARRFRFFLEGFGRRAHNLSQIRFVTTMHLLFEPTGVVTLNDLREQLQSLSKTIATAYICNEVEDMDQLDSMRTVVEQADHVEGLTDDRLDKYATELNCLAFSMLRGVPLEALARQIAYMAPLLD